MKKKTITQISKDLRMAKNDIRRILANYPILRPSEREDKTGGYLWSEGEIDCLKMHRSVHPRRKRASRWQ